MFIEKRSEPRVVMALPLKVGDDGMHAVTRDVSPSGLYFRLAGEQVLRGTLDFEMDLEEANMKFTARGSVVRIEHGNGFTGIAVKLVAGHLASIVA